MSGLSTRSDPAAVRRLVGFVFTDPDAQIVMPTVAEDVALGLRRRKLDAAESRRRVFAALSDFGLEIFADHPAHLLSGGQKQLLALCSVLVDRAAGAGLRRAHDLAGPPQHPTACWRSSTGFGNKWSW